MSPSASERNMRAGCGIKAANQRRIFSIHATVIEPSGQRPTRDRQPCPDLGLAPNGNPTPAVPVHGSRHPTRL